jgi:pimeloyl-ACP methyl ester carboxylesterase
MSGLILVLFGIAVVGIFIAFMRDLTDARARVTGHSEIVSTPHGTLEYATAGNGPPVLSIHGAGGGFDQALDMTGALAGRGYKIVAPSRFGYLGSDFPADATVAMQADAYVALLDRLGIDKIFVVAISAGAWSATQFAIRHPERCRALVLLVPADFLPPGTKNFGGPLVRAIFGSDFVAWAAAKSTPLMPGAMTRMMLGTDAAVVQTASPDEKARVQQVLDHLLPVSARFKGMLFDIATAATPAPYAVDRIECPVLAISTEDDAFGTATRARFVAETAPNGKAVIFPTGGHALVGRYDEVLNEVTSFFQSAADRKMEGTDATHIIR